LLVCPVTQPMYYGPNSLALVDARRTRLVYLPKGQHWFDFWSGKLHDGGQMIEAGAPLEHIPLFVRAGSIVPLTEPMQFVDEVQGAPYELHVYTGADAIFDLYKDAGDGYAYETGKYVLDRIQWSEYEQELVLHARKGGFSEMVREQEYRITFISLDGRREYRLRYKGDEVRLRMDEAIRCE
jgi:alpha-D-xyloside xylohydrolase